VTPLEITVDLVGAVAIPAGTLALDALLACAVAQRDNYPPPSVELRPIKIPIEREPDGRFHLCSFAVPTWDLHELRWINRRFPLPEAQNLGSKKLRRIRISAGAQKTYRLPIETGHLHGNQLTWWCIGDEDQIRGLLELVTHIGKKRAVGLGRVRSWRIVRCESWGEGFPIVRDGEPLRTLPADWPGLTAPELSYATLTYPYWQHEREVLCAVPRRNG
jgi:hypothetical protein